MKVNSFSVNVSGEQHPIFSDVFESYKIITNIRVDGSYDIDVSAVLEGTPPMVKLNVEGGYRIGRRSICPSEPRLGAGDFMRYISWISAFALLLAVIAIVWQLRPTEAAASVKSDTKPNE
ncbi:hypothetical protein BH11VER1_BH11VER1_37960 [soil metagenome]